MRHARHGSKQHVRIFTLKNLQKRFCIFNEIHWMNQLLQPPLSLSCVYKNHNVNVCLSINLVYFGFFWPIWFISTYAKNTPHKWNECCAISFSVDCGCGIPMNPSPPCVVVRSAHYAMYTFYIYSHSWFKQQRTFILIACALPKHCCSCSCLTSIIFNKKSDRNTDYIAISILTTRYKFMEMIVILTNTYLLLIVSIHLWLCHVCRYKVIRIYNSLLCGITIRANNLTKLNFDLTVQSIQINFISIWKWGIGKRVFSRFEFLCSEISEFEVHKLRTQRKICISKYAWPALLVYLMHSKQWDRRWLPRQ